jgi:hypothetical protein
MTKLKVVNSQTKSTYYLNNIDVSCAKLHSYIGETENNDIIIHKPSPYLEYSLENSGQPITYKTNVDELNGLYTRELSPDFSGYFPANHGIILSELLIDDNCMNYITNRIGCADLSLTTTTYWCPPVIDRSKFMNNNLQSTRIISFSYIHKNWYSNLFQDGSCTTFMVYNNKNLSNVNSDHIFGLFTNNALSLMCTPKYYCPSGAIGVCSPEPDIDTSCNQSCNSNSWHLPCKNYKDLCNNNHPETYNELIIKSWNYNPKSSMSDRGVIYNASMDNWIAQTPNPESPWGWNDVSSLSSNENIPLLAFGVTVQDRTTISDISKMLINNMYIELSNNLELSFNEYRRATYTDARNPPIPLMPYRIGLDISCLTRRDCSNPFFDISFILHHP